MDTMIISSECPAPSSIPDVPMSTWPTEYAELCSVASRSTHLESGAQAGGHTHARRLR
jgi:hypothetical protein